MAERDVTHRLRRAVKENNLNLVKRLIQRTDMRNPDAHSQRYTSLAWAAVFGCEEVFEYLLLNGHDDEELSKDSEKNTILCILAALKSSNLNPNATYSNTNYGSSTSYIGSFTGSSGMSADDLELQRAAIRMGRMYWERFPFVTDWCNSSGKTALHIASLNGRDEFVQFLCEIGADIDLSDNQGNSPLHYASAYGHVSVIQTLIERGCNFNMKNNDGFTPSDYAYSNNTFEALQETARTRFEVNKKSRVVAQQQARRQAYTQPTQSRNHGDLYDDYDDIHPSSNIHLTSMNHASSHHARRGLAPNGTRKWRSGSQTTSTSDSTDYDGPGPSNLATGLPGSAPGSSQYSGHSSSGSLPRAPPSNGTILTPILSANRARNTSTSSQPTYSSSGYTSAPSHSSRPSFGSSATNGRSTSQGASSLGAAGVLSGVGGNRAALSPVASRMLERDAAAISDYRTRSGSHSSTTTAETQGSNFSGLLPPGVTSTQTIPGATPTSTTPGYGSAIPISPLDDLQMSDLRARTIPRSLRPSLSAASLRPNITMPSISSVASGASNPFAISSNLNNTGSNNNAGSSRIRAGTTGNLPYGPNGSSGSSVVGTPKTPPTAVTLLGALKRPVLAVLPGGRADPQGNLPNGHTRRPSGSLLRDMASRMESM